MLCYWLIDFAVLLIEIWAETKYRMFIRILTAWRSFINCKSFCIFFTVHTWLTRTETTVYHPLPIWILMTIWESWIFFYQSFAIRKVFQGFSIWANVFSFSRLIRRWIKCTFLFNVLKRWIRIMIFEKVFVFITVIFNFILYLVTHIVWEIIRDTIRMAHMSIITQFINLLKLWVIVKVRDDWY